MIRRHVCTLVSADRRPWARVPSGPGRRRECARGGPAPAGAARRGLLTPYTCGSLALVRFLVT